MLSQILIFFDSLLRKVSLSLVYELDIIDIRIYRYSYFSTSAIFSNTSFAREKYQMSLPLTFVLVHCSKFVISVE